MIGELGDEDLRDSRFGGQTALDQPRRGRRLDHDVLADATPILRSPDDQHPELRRHDVEAFGNILADAMQCPRAARADRARHIDHRLDPWQMGRQRPAVGAALGGAPFPFGRKLLLALGMTGCFDLLGLLESELQLIHRQAFGAPSKAVTLELLDDLAQAIALGTLGQQHRLEQIGIVGQGIRWRSSHTRGNHNCRELATVFKGCERFFDQLGATGAMVRSGS